jgi:hypothetical protein
MGDFLCRLTYFRYTGAISERNMDRRLRVGNDEISENGDEIGVDLFIRLQPSRAMPYS